MTQILILFVSFFIFNSRTDYKTVEARHVVIIFAMKCLVKDSKSPWVWFTFLSLNKNVINQRWYNADLASRLYQALLPKTVVYFIQQSVSFIIFVSPLLFL